MRAWLPFACRALPRTCPCPDCPCASRALTLQVVERMTGQVCRELELDPSNPLARMVPIGVLEEAGVEVRRGVTFMIS